MHIALVGYGKMGMEIERLALQRGWNVDLRIDIDTPPVKPEQRKAVDVVIHFAQAQSIVADLTPWAESQKPIVVGTTGWREQLPAIEALVKKQNIGLKR